MTIAQLDIGVWIASGVLALLYLIAGGTKALGTKETLQGQQRMAYITDLSARQVKAIGILEVAGAVGVILPHLTGILPWLSIVAAFAFVAVQAVALVVHVRRGEFALAFNLVLLVFAAAVGVGLLVTL
jgi:hypothetical protein